MIDDDAEVAQGLGHGPNVFDLRDVGEAAPLAGQGGGRQQLECRVLGPADRHRPAQGSPALDPENLANDGLRMELPVERARVSHSNSHRRRAAAQARAAPGTLPSAVRSA
jgi:hypothetical protein